MNTTKLLATLIAVCPLVAVSSVNASPITFTITGTASGTVGTTSFTSAPFVFTLTTDTTARTALIPGASPNTYSEQTTANSFSITGVGTGSFTDTLDVFDNQMNALAGVTQYGTGFPQDQFDLGNTAFSTYGLLTPLDPVSTTSTTLVSDAPTTRGSLTFTSFASPTFAAAAPEPSTWAVVLGGAGLLGLTLRQRRVTHG